MTAGASRNFVGKKNLGSWGKISVREEKISVRGEKISVRGEKSRFVGKKISVEKKARFRGKKKIKKNRKLLSVRFRFANRNEITELSVGKPITNLHQTKPRSGPTENNFLVLVF